MRKLILAACLLAGCVTQKTMSLRDAEGICAISSSFEQHAKCVSSTFDAGYPNWRMVDRDSDLLGLYFQWMTTATTKIREGALNEADANLQGSMLYAQMMQIGMQRNADARAQQAQSLNNALIGLGLLQAAHPAPPPNPPVYCSSRPLGNTVQTVCH